MFSMMISVLKVVVRIAIICMNQLNSTVKYT